MNYSTTCWQPLWESLRISTFNPLKNAGMLVFILIIAHSHGKFLFIFLH